MKTLNFFFSLLICLFFYCCKKNDTQDYVPNVYVDIYMSASQPSFSNLNTVTGWAYITGGARGIIVYRKSITDFMAYDRNCAYQSSNSCAIVSVDSTNLIIEDACCGSKFIITDGSVNKGPATLPLKSYQTTFDGNTLHIFN